MVRRIALGMIHGRFQPFHNGHLAYLRGAAERAERLLVGITNPDERATRAEAADPHRHLPAANPFTYAERREMIEAVLADEGVREARVLPFPVSQPDLWPGRVSLDAVHFVRVFDHWGTVKAERLRAAGYEVVVLDEGASKEVSGTRVRELLRAGGDWEPLVPPAVARVIRALPAHRARDLRRTA